MDHGTICLVCLLPVHVDDSGGDGDDHTQQGGQQAETTAEFNLKNSAMLSSWMSVLGWAGLTRQLFLFDVLEKSITSRPVTVICNGRRYGDCESTVGE